MAENKNYEIISLTFFKDWHELAKKYNLTNEQYGRLIHAMCEYCFYGKDTELDEYAGMMFEMSKPIINKSNNDKINGSKGGTQARGKSGARIGNDNATKKKRQTIRK